MGVYLAMRIISGAIDYYIAIDRYPQFKTEIDKYLTDRGFIIPQ